MKTIYQLICAICVICGMMSCAKDDHTGSINVSGSCLVEKFVLNNQYEASINTEKRLLKVKVPVDFTQTDDMIITEMALEGAFEGYRFNDLMRVALRRNDPAYLADPVSQRNAASAGLRQKLMDPKNWYLPLR